MVLCWQNLLEISLWHELAVPPFWCWRELSQRGISLEAFCCRTSQVLLATVGYSRKLPALQELGKLILCSQLEMGESVHTVQVRGWSRN